MIDMPNLPAGNQKQLRRWVAAILFTGAATQMYDAFSAVNSSPWTAESFGGDPEKEKSLREYVKHGLGVASVVSLIAAVIARSIWPIVGGGVAGGYMFWLYERAITRAKTKHGGSTGWEGSNGNAPVASGRIR